MRTIRPITWIGLALGIAALIAIPIDITAAFFLGSAGIAISIYALMTSPPPTR